jgi:hypothetical protein
VNITQLRDFLNETLAAGCSPDTEVVVATDGWYQLLSEVTSPVRNEDYNSWVTIFVSDEEADSRFTSAHIDSEPIPVPAGPEIVFPPVTAQQLDRKARSLFP